MITIRFLTSIAGNDFSFERGDEIDWPDERDACSLCAAGIAQPIDERAKKVFAEYQATEAKKPKAKPPAKPKPEPPKEPEGENEGGGKTQDLHSDVPVDKLDLDDTTIAALQSAGLQTAGQVAAYGDLTKLHGVGKATAAKINQALAKL